MDIERIDWWKEPNEYPIKSRSAPYGCPINTIRFLDGDSIHFPETKIGFDSYLIDKKNIDGEARSNPTNNTEER